MSYTLEIIRSLHEDIELYEDEIVKLLKEQPVVQEERVSNGHIVQHLNGVINSKTLQLMTLYEDSDKVKENELRLISYDPSNSGGVLQTFYNKIALIKEKYADKQPEFPPRVGPTDEDYSIQIPFSGEETFGKCLDLTTIYNEMINLVDGGTEWKYIDFVRSFWDWDSDDYKQKRYKTSWKKWKEYIYVIYCYVVGFMKRSQPLVDVDSKVGQIVEKFEEVWKNNDSHIINDNSIENVLYCSFCDKSFSNPSVIQSHVKSKRHLKLLQCVKNEEHDVALQMYVIKTLMNGQEMKTIVDNTIENINIKMGRTAMELDELSRGSMIEEINIVEQDLEEEEKKKGIDDYPIGEDGRPMPFWLYKLHGLGTEYKCEICGNKVYLGRRNYEKHFQEAQHIRGLKCLGIPNSVEFFDICRIKDAVALHKKIEQDKADKEFDPENDEEFEDGDGNIITKKDYVLLQKQGLI
ncbi:Splicing factor 3A subunit 3 [Entamoeba marina]